MMIAEPAMQHMQDRAFQRPDFGVVDELFGAGRGETALEGSLDEHILCGFALAEVGYPRDVEVDRIEKGSARWRIRLDGE
jgi:hypothetical protein